MTLRRRVFLAGIVAAPLLLALLAVVGVLLARQGGLEPFRVPTRGSMPRSSAELIERGQYLATLGNCAGCHTRKGGDLLGGGRAFRTDYGTVYSTNLTPDSTHGIGAWSTEEFRHAMRHGVSRNGVLSPVFPYASFRHLDDDDLDAILAYLRSLPASNQPRPSNDLQFPANLPGAMAAWRLLYVRPIAQKRIEDARLARGAYLVGGIGHCATCHATRGAFASQGPGSELWGARNAGWFAPELHGASLRRFEAGELARYLKGDAPRAIGGYGLMADVIAGNLRHLRADDAEAMEAYLRALPSPPPKREPALKIRASDESLRIGRTVYEQHCADCHGARGEGEAGKYPALRGSAAAAQEDPINLVKLVLFGAVAPSTPSHPAPYTMPPFAQTLSTEEVAGVVNMLRLQENPQAMPVGAGDIQAMGGIQ